MEVDAAEYFTDPSIVQDAWAFAEFQEIIFDVDSSCIAEAKSYVVEIVNSKEMAQRFGHYLYLACLIRSKSIPLLIEVVKYVVAQESVLAFVGDIVESFLGYVFEPLVSKSEFMEKAGPLKFCRLLIDQELCSDVGIIGRMFEFRAKFEKHRNLFLMFFIWFAPEIEKHETKFFDEFREEYKTKSLLKMIPPPMAVFFENFADFIGNGDWRMFREITINAYGPNSLEAIIAGNQIRLLELKTSVPGFDYNVRIRESVFESNLILQNRPSPVQFAAFHGAIDCMKYLMVGGSVVEEHEYGRHPSLSFAIAGGDHEAVRILERETVTFSEAAQIAAEFHRHSVFRWLFEGKSLVLDEIVIHHAIRTENYAALFFCLIRDVDVNYRDPAGRTALYIACLPEHADVVRFVLNHTRIDVNRKAVLLRFFERANISFERCMFAGHSKFCQVTFSKG